MEDVRFSPSFHFLSRTDSSFVQVISTLVTFALTMLKPGGRLVFFLPTDNAEYSDVDVPSVPGLTLISNSSQSFGKWARRLITMEKEHGDEWKKATDGLDRGVRRKGQKSALEIEREAANEQEQRRPGHADFYKRYMNAFSEPLQQKGEELVKSVEKLSVASGEEKAAQ